MKHTFLALLFAAAASAQAAEVTIQQTTVKAGDVDVPVDIAIPAGNGPFPPVLFIHAKRGIDENERRHITELAQQGFLVVMPDWQRGA